MIAGKKPIEGYPHYAVTEDGQVITLRKGRALRPLQLTKGYQGVRLYNDRGGKTKKIHRLVAEAFLPPLEGKTLVNHKDGDKTNNMVSNLEWCDNQENIDHSVSNGLWIPQCRQSHVYPEVARLARLRATGKVIQEATGLSRNHAYELRALALKGHPFPDGIIY